MPDLPEALRKAVGEIWRSGIALDNPLGTAAGAIDSTADSAQLAEAMKEIRSLLQRTAVAIGAVASVVIAGLSLTQLHEIFPIPASVSWISKALVAGFLGAAVLGSAWLPGRFFSAQRRILVASNIDEVKGLGRRDRKLAEKVLNEHASEQNGASLTDVESRALRFSRIGTSASAQKDAASEAAARLIAAVTIALDRAAATILEDRARRAFKGWQTWTALMLAAGGILGVFAIADYYKGERSLLTFRQSCLKAELEGVAGACAPFETDAQRRDRTIAVTAAAARKAIEESAAAKKPTQAQKEVLARIDKCAPEINKRVAAGSLPAELRSDAIALCAASN